MIIYKPSPTGAIKIYDDYTALSSVADVKEPQVLMSLCGNYSENDKIAAYQKMLMYKTVYLTILLSSAQCLFINPSGGQYYSIGNDMTLNSMWIGTSIKPKYRVTPEQVGVGFIRTKSEYLQISRRPAHLFKDGATGFATDGIEIFKDMRVQYIPKKSCPLSMYNEMIKQGHSRCLAAQEGVVYFD